MKLLLILILAGTSLAQAEIITWTGIVTSVDLDNVEEPAAALGDPVFGYIDINPGTLLMKEASLSLPGGGVGVTQMVATKVPGGYSFLSDFVGGGLGFDSVMWFTVLLDGSGNFYASGTNDIFHPVFRQQYTGDITSVTVSSVPDTGSTLGLFGLGLAALALLQKQQTK